MPSSQFPVRLLKQFLQIFWRSELGQFKTKSTSHPTDKATIDADLFVHENKIIIHSNEQAYRDLKRGHKSGSCEAAKDILESKNEF